MDVIKKKPQHGRLLYTHPDGRKEYLTEFHHFGMLEILRKSFIARGYIADRLKKVYGIE